jgi:sigma-E factor negative regulatory protein RseA
MTEAIREQISALLDGEISARELSASVEQLHRQDELRETWGRYHLIGDAIRGESLSRARPSIADRVREQIALEPAILAPRAQPGHPSWVRPLAGAALAASVAVMAIFSAPYLFDATPGGQSQAANSSLPVARYVQAAQPVTYRVVSIPTPPRREAAIASHDPDRYVERTGTRWKNLAQPTVESKLNRYLVNHGEYATQTGVRGVTPYVTFVGYDAEQQ